MEARSDQIQDGEGHGQRHIHPRSWCGRPDRGGVRDWNDWSAGTDVMRRDAAGGFSLTVDLQAGRIYRFRYLLDGERWDNDWAADAYVPNRFGGDDSVVDLTALAETVPAAAKKAPAKKETAKKPAPAKKPTPVQTTKKAAAPAAKPARKTAE